VVAWLTTAVSALLETIGAFEESCAVTLMAKRAATIKPIAANRRPVEMGVFIKAAIRCFTNSSRVNTGVKLYCASYHDSLPFLSGAIYPKQVEGDHNISQ
jgi:hypothetical protein